MSDQVPSTLRKLGLPIDAFPGFAVPLFFSILALEIAVGQLDLSTHWDVMPALLHLVIVILGAVLALIAYVGGDFWDVRVFDPRYGRGGTWRNRDDRPLSLLPEGRALAQLRERAGARLNAEAESQRGSYRRAKSLLESGDFWRQVSGPLAWSKAFRSLIWPSFLLGLVCAVWATGSWALGWPGGVLGLSLAALGFCILALLMFLPYISLRVEHMMQVYQKVLGLPTGQPTEAHATSLAHRWYESLRAGSIRLELDLRASRRHVVSRPLR